MLVSMKTATASNDITCISQVMYAEARGEPTEGTIAVGNTLVKRMKEWRPRKTACQHAYAAYQQKAVPKNLQGYYRLLAQGLLSGAISDVTNGADSFDSTRRKPKGKLTRRIGGHQFYIMK